MKPIVLFGREPAAWLALFAVAVKMFSAFVIEVDEDTQAYVNAAAAAGMGVFIAWATKDGVVAAILGLVQAVIALAVGLGLDWDVATQAVVLSFVSLALGAYDRTQVTAPVPSQPKPTLSGPTAV
jgi:microsomal dipeptidase-like Zn-dependent dipeptidase